MQVEDVITVSVVDVKGKPTLDNVFITRDVLTDGLESTIRVFKTGALTKDHIGQDWRARVVNIRPIDYERRTKDERVYVYIDVELLMPVVYQCYMLVGDKLVLKSTCGSRVTRVPIEVAKVYEGWFKLGEETAVKGKIYYNDSGIAICHECLWGGVDRVTFIEQERKGLEDILSPLSVNARFNKLPTSIGRRLGEDF